MKHIPHLAMALAASLGTASLFAADDWLQLPSGGSTPPAAPAAGADKTAPAAPGASPSTAPDAGGSATGWLFTTEQPPAGTADPSAAGPVSAEAAAALTNMKQKDAFTKFWSTYARAFIPWNDDYVSLPTYNPLHPNSSGLSADQVKDKMTKTVTVQDLNVRKQQAIAPPYPEIQAAAMTIPSMEVGQYGYIHSFKVDKILGPDEMLVKDIWLIDADATLKEKQAIILEAERKAKAIGDSNEAIRRASTSNNNNSNNNNYNNANFGPNASTLMAAAREEINARYTEREKVINRNRTGGFTGPFKVKGYPTSGVLEGQRWTGPSSAVGKTGQGMQIAVIRVVENKPVERQNNSFNRFGVSDPKTRMLEITPTYSFRTGLNQEAFVTMLAKRSITPDQFVDMVIAEIKRDNEGAKGRVFLLLEEARRKWEADTKAKAEEARKEAELKAKEAEKAAKEAERKAREQQRKSTR